MCNDCGEAVDIDSRFRQRTLRDRLIFGLEDQTMQKEVLKEKLGDLSLNRTREICRSYEGSTKTHDKMQNKEIRHVSKKETLWRSSRRQEDVKLQAGQDWRRQQHWRRCRPRWWSRKGASRRGQNHH